MHGGTPLPPRGVQKRGASAKADRATLRATLFAVPPPARATSSVRLPNLTPSVTTPPLRTHSSRGISEAALQSARLRYTSSLKRTARGPFNGATSISVTASPPSALPTLESVEPARRPESRKLTASVSCSHLCSVTNTSPSPGSSSSLDVLLETQRYAELYLVLSTLLPITSRRLLKDDAHTVRILGYRAICSCVLLRFKESAEDGMASLDIRRQLRQVGCVLSGEDDLRLNALVDECVVRALVLGERYEEADKAARSLLCSSSLPCPGVGGHRLSANGPTVSAWLSAIPHIKRFRSAVAAHQWREALAVMDGDDEAAAAASTCLRASQLCVMLAFAHLEAGHPMTARGLLLAYLADLPEPPTWEAMLTAPSEHELLWDSFRSHYVSAITLLAKASVMSGSAYLNIAAALLQRCLRVLPVYTPARLLAEFVLSYESQKESLEAAVSRQDLTAALHISARMLAMPEVSPALQAEVSLTRTQAQWLRRLPLEVVREASQCIAADPTCALAFRLRADALEAMHQVAEAMTDRATATHLNARVEAAYAELQAQRKKYDAAQRAAESQRMSFIAFTAAAPPASNHTGNLWGPSENNTTTGNADEALPNGSTNANTSASTSSSRAAAASQEPTHYMVLGVPQHATLSEIRQRYHHLILQCHPDRLVNASADRRQQAAEVFKRVSNAYSVLSDVQQRTDYDAALRASF
ncbi:hypothetical protein ABL78_2916 [Leptomonas seymouri]|uniref:J domain-containing protein n=1 Tax=Leptomonas seymouri TaxID=5684 RepID=A0A0N1PD42_LEPSE|nr:hypothetical protein ABL78_2916 [Leptomonas seymouri]|eukprot:KPI87980.1 hypothetical protein ABL78_2916 [Leptomonas seymouri]